MALYSLALGMVLALSAPYWLVRMVGSGRYREGLWGRLGRVPLKLREAVAGKQVVWLHAVSVGELLAATRLVAELEAALGVGWIIVVSTTTATGQRLAKERFGAEVGSRDRRGGAARVFWYPLDFAWAVRAYLRALKPKMLVLMESELWPRMLVECGRQGTPVAVVNARVSDRSYARGMKLRVVWGWVLRRVNLFLAQSAEDGRRLVEMGARKSAVRAVGNLKYDVRAPKESHVARLIKEVIGDRPLIVAGSTVGSVDDKNENWEEEQLMEIWPFILEAVPDAVLLVAPRHPQRFTSAISVMSEHGVVKATELITDSGKMLESSGKAIICLNTIGDLAAVYSLARVSFVGGSLVVAGGHNPLEPAQFGVPVVMGPSFENFRDVVNKMQAADAISIVRNAGELQPILITFLLDHEKARTMGERGRRVFEEQQGATGRTVIALMEMVKW